MLKEIMLKSNHLSGSLRCLQNWYCYSSTVTAPAAVLTADQLLSEENRQRCIQCMQHAPPMAITRLSKSKSESNFAAVLIAICTNVQGEPSVLYTRRSIHISRHVRQIAFPGGLRDPTDADYIDCALRETEEEIGLPRERVQVWGIGSLITPPHTPAIMPVIATVEDFELGQLQINHHEVEEAFVVPVSQLIHPKTFQHTQFRGGYSAPIFVVSSKYKIWGVTGLLTNIFLNCLVPKDLYSFKKKRIRYVKPFKNDRS